MNRHTAPPEAAISRTTADLLVSYPGKQFARARREIADLLTEFGDTEPHVIKTAVWGIAAVHTALNSREVIRRCRALWHASPQRFRFALKWLPVDFWCATSLPEIRAVIEGEIAGRIAEHETWAMRVQKRRWEAHSTREIVRALAVAIPRKVDLGHPDWIVWVDVVGRGTALSLLKPEEIFAPLAREAAPIPGE